MRLFSCFFFYLILHFVLTITNGTVSISHAKPPWQDWQSTLLQDHTLVGKIYATKDAEFITPSQLVSRLAYLDYSLLGEIHDNPDHHRIQAWLIKNIVGYDRRPAVVFEMIDKTQSTTLETYLQKVKARQQKRPAKNFGPALSWSKRGWPDWRIYQPIAEVAFRYNLAIAAANPPRKYIKGIMKKGLPFLTSEQRSTLKLSYFITPPLTKSMKEELSAAHCHLLPNSILAPMANAQRFKDATMAKNLISAGEEKGAVMIVGSGHVRADRGIPHYLKKHIPDARIASLVIAEVKEKNKTIDSYVTKDIRGRATVDFIWLTPRHDRPDPCEQLKENLKK